MTDSRHIQQQSLGELTKQLTRDASALVRGEIALAKAEVGARAQTLARGVAMLAAAALLAVITVACLVAAAIAALSLAVDTWLAALIVAAAVAILALLIGLLGRGALRAAGPPLPVDTIEAAKEDMAWVRTQAKSDAT
jgi:Putative Actinobacterial Holin-X, holin superfamily III